MLILQYFHNVLFWCCLDIRVSELVQGRSINLALSVRGRKALARIGLEEKLLKHGIPMRGRMLHDLKGRTQFVPYDPNGNQVCFMWFNNINSWCFFFIFYF